MSVATFEDAVAKLESASTDCDRVATGNFDPMLFPLTLKRVSVVVFEVNDWATTSPPSGAQKQVLVEKLAELRTAADRLRSAMKPHLEFIDLRTPKVETVNEALAVLARATKRSRLSVHSREAAPGLIKFAALSMHVVQEWRKTASPTEAEKAAIAVETDALRAEYLKLRKVMGYGT